MTNILEYIKNYKWIFIILLFVIILSFVVYIPIGIFISFVLGSYLYGYSKYLSMLRGRLTNEGPYPLEWFDNICYINSINYMFSCIDDFGANILSSINLIENVSVEYRDMINSLINLISHINRSYYDKSINRLFIKHFREVCLGDELFWKNSYGDKSDLGNCAGGDFGSPHIYLERILESSGLSEIYPFVDVVIRSKIMEENLNGIYIPNTEYVFIYMTKRGKTRMNGLREKRDIKKISENELYIVINGFIYDIISYNHLYGNPIYHALTTRRLYDKDGYKWFKMIMKGDGSNVIAIDLKEIKRNLLWGNTFYLLKKRS